LGEAAYLGTAGEFLRAVAPFTEATDVGVLGHFLSAAGMLLGPKIHVWSGGKQPARYNVAPVGPTNTGRKGTSATPVDLLLEQAVEQFWLKQRMNGLSSGEGLIAYLQDKEYQGEDGEPKVEKVEKRLWVVEEEFSRVLANIRREGNVLSQVL